ncbi:unnamed protein product, partial [Strongylus vulgaris]
VVAKEEEKRKKSFKRQLKEAQEWGYADLLYKKEAIETDITISEAEADKREEQFVKVLTRQRREDYESLGRKRREKACTRFFGSALFVLCGIAFVF